MPHYQHNGLFNGQPVNIAAFVAQMQMVQNATGPLWMIPVPPGNQLVNNNLGANQTLFSAIAPNPIITRAIGLITCAAVIYVSTDPSVPAGAWVHHANAGHVTPANVQEAMDRLDNPNPDTILVVFAHPGQQDRGYQDSITTITNARIPANNIVEISDANRLLPSFGINNQGIIGV